MNQIEKEYFGLLDMTHKVRDQGLVIVLAEDLEFALPGCPSVGELLLEFGDVEWSYTNSFRTFVQDFEAKAPGRDSVKSGQTAVAWLNGLDAQLKEALAALSEDDLSSKQVERGGWQMPIAMNFHTYREAVIILMGRIDSYLRAIGKQRPEQWQHWIG